MQEGGEDFSSLDWVGVSFADEKWDPPSFNTHTGEHYGFLYEVKRGFRCVESQILNASSTGFSNIRLCTFDEPIKMDILKLKKVVKKVT